jgi:hypothetical protein
LVDSLIFDGLLEIAKTRFASYANLYK